MPGSAGGLELSEWHDCGIANSAHKASDGFGRRTEPEGRFALLISGYGSIKEAWASSFFIASLHSWHERPELDISSLPSY